MSHGGPRAISSAMGKTRPFCGALLLATISLAGCSHPAGKPADLRNGSPTVVHQAMLFPSSRERLPPLASPSATPAAQRPGITTVMRSGSWVDVQWSAPPGTATVQFTPDGGKPQTLISGSTATSWSFTTNAAHGVVQIQVITDKRHLTFTRQL
jgi:hypothetical protein